MKFKVQRSVFVGIQIRNYSKTLNNEKVLENINMTFEYGNIYGVVGKNGSGKSLLLKSICGFANIKEGEIKIDNQILGKDLEFPKNIGAILDGAGFLNNLSGFENLKILASINNQISDNEIYKVMNLLGLDPLSTKKYKVYSLGMKQKLAICQAIMEDSKILILDEVFNALDEDTVVLMRNILKQFRNEGKLIIITSHIKEDIDTLCNQVYQLNNGKIEKERTV